MLLNFSVAAGLAWHLQTELVFLSFSEILRVTVVRGVQMLALSRCSPALRTLALRCSVGGATLSSESASAASAQFLRTQTALFHQSKAKASADPHKPASGKDLQYLSAYS